MASDEYVCPVCKQPVETVVRRHKTLGIFVPVWGPGPCQNPKCSAYETDEPERAHVLTAGTGRPKAPKASEGREAPETPTEKDS
jgi:hypothetical protein